MKKKRIAKKLKTKSAIIAEIAKKKKIPHSTSALFVKVFFDEISKALVKGKRVELRGFGTFGVKKYKAYKGRNPKTQEVIKVKAKKRPWFKPGVFNKKLK